MFYADFILKACDSGAQLSSYASFISKGDVALCILLTTYTTIVPVDSFAMSKSILQVVLVAVTLGLLNTYAKPVVSVIQPVMPFVAMICTSLYIGIPLAIN
uniref:Probable sodium/metabolite cotransporter BASS3, chloroplastic n=1 Tax=Cicer arietinum TaxID=3827 RepID=A0A3Q7XJK8_CICAR|nr:probable sodium/metabolite cotransporter BASS3, chloroplastic [Cicer arietinum]